MSKKSHLKLHTDGDVNLSHSLRIAWLDAKSDPEYDPNNDMVRLRLVLHKSCLWRRRSMVKNALKPSNRFYFFFSELALGACKGNYYFIFEAMRCMTMTCICLK